MNMIMTYPELCQIFVSSIRPIPITIDRTIYEYDNEYKDKIHEFVKLSQAQTDLS